MSLNWVKFSDGFGNTDLSSSELRERTSPFDRSPCANCPHKGVNHGDRAVAACDGGVSANWKHLGLAAGGKLSVCHCPGFTHVDIHSPGDDAA